MHTKMDPVVKARWVAALRSGAYKQGRTQLRTKHNTFCCLGVLCNLHAQAHPEFAANETDPTTYEKALVMPPTRVINWARMPSGAASRLATMNDNGLSFESIADHIERNL